MSNDDAPAGSAGGPSALADLPERLRVHALARLIGRTSREVLAILNEQGIEVRSAQSSVERRVAEQVVSALLPEAEPENGEDVRGADVIPEAAEAVDAAEPIGISEAAAADETAETATTSETVEAIRVAEASDTAESGEALAESTSAEAAGPEQAEPAPAAETVADETPLTPLFAPPAPVFQPPERPTRARRGDAAPEAAPEPAPTSTDAADEPVAAVETPASEVSEDSGDEDEGGARRRRRRGRRGRGRGRGSDGAQSGDDETGESSTEADTEVDTEADTEAEDDIAGVEADAGADAENDAEGEGEDTGEGEAGASRRRRRRRRRASGDDNGDLDATPDPPDTVTKIRPTRDRSAEDEGSDGVQSVRGSTRLEAKRQRRRDGRDAGRRRAPILSEAEFLARRESVDRSMIVREQGDRVEIGVLEDGILVEHFVTGGDGSNANAGNSMVGNIYLGRVQNVLPSMEAAFVDIGRGRNAVLYAGEVDWDAAGLNGKARRIEQALTSGDSILVQVTKDPIGHKGARLTTQISLAGRFLVYVPSGGAAGISRKLPDTERRRLKEMLKEIVPNEAGVIIRTASEGVSQEALERDVRRLQAQWEVIKNKAEATGPNKPKAPALLYEEPDLLIKVIRDQFNEDFSRLVVSGDDAWDIVSNYIGHVAPELSDRLHRHVGPTDVFTEYRIDEQLLKALDRKVWLPSGGTLVIDRTEAMTVIDVNTGKFTGSGGNLEETVTRNNLEAAEEIVRQLRLRDIGGIIVIDFIDMVLEANRDLVLRRLTECLARDRTRHQVAEVTSLGLVQMTRKRVGGGLLEHFSTPCEHCRGRGVIVSTEPVEHRDTRRSRAARARRADESAPDERAQQEYRTSGAATAAAAVAAAAPAAASRVRIPAPNGHTGEDRSATNGTSLGGTSTVAVDRPAPASDAPAPSQQAPPVPAPSGSVPSESAPSAGAPSAPTLPAPRPAAADTDPAADTEPAPRPRRRGRVTRSAGAPSEAAAAVITAPPPGEAPRAAAVPVGIPEQPKPSTAVRPRRARRAASRPAGPPTGADAGGDPV
ncbi:translation initiation factor IF-2 N-terminal domain-containing protein [Pseudonocardia asaccharolytica]|uniref:Ribonuclease E n=1 Tax=Pseudonocardia asaccharolytica DSM 44247 = NBRC 16224 TaxID=1123024 RepID=A0A511CW95_9PSEU|nr:translation initiation factor IF-2 N-terminal domain-containing protein [Pseudonocardia asaccharolytica]GEL16821.1 ribonuclease E [Pseudonocardia asaccharolytica DSM 44247 = NBRC 16224]